MFLKFVKKTFVLPLVSLCLILSLVLTSCKKAKDKDISSQHFNSTIQNNVNSLVLPPLWTQTEYVFQNKTDSQIVILGASKIIINVGECVYIEHLPFNMAYEKITKAGKGLICGRPCSPTESCDFVRCSDKLDSVYQKFRRNINSQFPYLEVYNIVDTKQIFKAGIHLPILADDVQKAHWKEKCQSFFP